MVKTNVKRQTSKIFSMILEATLREHHTWLQNNEIYFNKVRKNSL